MKMIKTLYLIIVILSKYCANVSVREIIEKYVPYFLRTLISIQVFDIKNVRCDSIPREPN